MPKSPVVRALCASLLADDGRCHRRRHQTRQSAPPARVPGLDQVQHDDAGQWHEGHRLDRSRHSQRRALQLGARRQPQRSARHHRPRALLRTHDVQRHGEAHARRVRPAHGSAGRLQQRVHQRRRHGVPGLDSAHRARPGVRPGSRSPRKSRRSIPRSSRANAASSIPSGACAPKTATMAFSPSRCRPRRSSRIPTRFPPSAGRPTSRAGRSKTCRSSSRRTTRLTTAR